MTDPPSGDSPRGKGVFRGLPNGGDYQDAGGAGNRALTRAGENLPGGPGGDEKPSLTSSGRQEASSGFSESTSPVSSSEAGLSSAVRPLFWRRFIFSSCFCFRAISLARFSQPYLFRATTCLRGPRHRNSGGGARRSSENQPEQELPSPCHFKSWRVKSPALAINQLPARGLGRANNNLL